MVERRFSALAGQTMATMQMRLNIDPMKKQLSFRFGPEQRSSKVSFHSNAPGIDLGQRSGRSLAGRNPTASFASSSPCGIS